MDHRSTAQDIHRCDICEAAIIHSYCDFCHVYLCKLCIGEHISDGYQNHAIVPFEERRSTLIYPKCPTHPQKSCDLHCKDCNIYICTFCLGSKQHKGHDIRVLADIYKEKKETILKEGNELKNLLSPTYEEMIHDLEKQIANLDKGYGKLTAAIFKHGEEWHKEIDVIITNMKTEIYEIKIKHKDILQKHLDEIKQIQSLIDQTAQTLKEIEESNEVSMTIGYKSKNSEFSKLPLKVMVSLPTFIPEPVDQQKLYSLFGQIRSIPTALKQYVLTPNKQSNTSVRKLLDEPELVLEIQTSLYNLRNVAYVTDEKIWTTGETDEIKCLNDRGHIIRTIRMKFMEWPDDIVVDSYGDLIFSASEARTVNKVKNEQSKVLIKLKKWTPGQLCITSTGDLLVTMFSDDDSQSKVVRYSGSTEKQTYQFDNEGEPLFSGNDNIKYITENKNNDICVADCEAAAIVVVDQYGKLRFRYTGCTTSIMGDSFEPHGITTDSQSRILTADSYSNFIHILDKNGQFLRHIYNCDLILPWGLCVDNIDNLFVCEYATGFVKKIKYCKFLI
ncbi:uncharacterized protein LOC128161464 [Crassostrea angulata]|uniref:uncharacterized protein LOC128161464 n=1 Tax=Magallana angulata TaxID=2784310 RepID=UPI0022B1CB9F|nr:uncharacterized protein LOC128161464 [Crassostrea angulata]